MLALFRPATRFPKPLDHYERIVHDKAQAVFLDPKRSRTRPDRATYESSRTYRATIGEPKRGLSTASSLNVQYRVGRIASYLSGRWLDYGCAEGGYCAALLDRGVSSIVGVDVEEDRIALANARFNPNATFEVFDGFSQARLRRSELRRRICVNEVFEHVADEQKVLQEVFRVLRTGGHLVLISPNLAGSQSTGIPSGSARGASAPRPSFPGFQNGGHEQGWQPGTTGPTSSSAMCATLGSPSRKRGSSGRCLSVARVASAASEPHAHPATHNNAETRFRVCVGSDSQRWSSASSQSYVEGAPVAGPWGQTARTCPVCLRITPAGVAHKSVSRQRTMGDMELAQPMPVIQIAQRLSPTNRPKAGSVIVGHLCRGSSRRECDPVGPKTKFAIVASTRHSPVPARQGGAKASPTAPRPRCRHPR